MTSDGNWNPANAERALTDPVLRRRRIRPASTSGSSTTGRDPRCNRPLRTTCGRGGPRPRVPHPRPTSTTLSGGEPQRARMARHPVSSTDITCVFDEPTIGLHPHDTSRMNAVPAVPAAPAASAASAASADRLALAQAPGRWLASPPPAEQRDRPAEAAARPGERGARAGSRLCHPAGVMVTTLCQCLARPR